MRLFKTMCVAVLLVLAAGACESVWACPFCRESLKSGDNRVPMAYMYSILFMLGMPPTILIGIGFAIYRAFRKHAAQLTAAEPATAEATIPAPAGTTELAPQ